MAGMFSVSVAADIASFQLNNYLKPSSPRNILRHIQKRPLLRQLESTKKEYGSGYAYVKEAVHGQLMSTQAGLTYGIRGDDVLNFFSGDNVTWTSVPISWVHTGFSITHDELLTAGIHLTSGRVNSTAEARTTLLELLETRLADFGESRAINLNLMLWGDGTADAKGFQGIRSIIVDDPTAAGNTLGVARTNVWWRHIARTAVGGALPKLAYSKADQTMTETINADRRQLTRYGGDPDVWLAGSDFCNALEREARAKGQLTLTGWANAKTNLNVSGIKFGQYEIEYDPTLDDMGYAKRCYAWDSNHLRLRPQSGEWAKLTDQNTPANQFIMLKSVTDRGALSCDQMDCCYVADME